MLANPVQLSSESLLYVLHITASGPLHIFIYTQMSHVTASHTHLMNRMARKANPRAIAMYAMSTPAHMGMV